MNYGTPLCPSRYAAILSNFDASGVALFMGGADHYCAKAKIRERPSSLLSKKRQAPLRDERSGAPRER